MVALIAAASGNLFNLLPPLPTRLLCREWLKGFPTLSTKLGIFPRNQFAAVGALVKQVAPTFQTSLDRKLVTLLAEVAGRVRTNNIFSFHKNLLEMNLKVYKC